MQIEKIGNTDDKNRLVDFVKIYSDNIILTVNLVGIFTEIAKIK
jgi:hypothetical protein